MAYWPFFKAFFAFRMAASSNKYDTWLIDNSWDWRLGNLLQSNLSVTVQHSAATLYIIGHRTIFREFSQIFSVKLTVNGREMYKMDAFTLSWRFLDLRNAQFHIASTKETLPNWVVRCSERSWATCAYPKREKSRKVVVGECDILNRKNSIQHAECAIRHFETSHKYTLCPPYHAPF